MARGRGLPAMAAGVVLLVGAGWVVRELFVGGTARELADAGSTQRPESAPPASANGEDPTADDARSVLAAATRALPQRTVTPAEESDPDRLDAPRAARRRAPRPGSERYFLESCKALAASDVAAFETAARECLAKPASLAEKVAWLLAARDLGAERYAALVDCALEEGRRADPRLRVAAVELLERDARRSGSASLRLLRVLALAPGANAADPAERARAASDAFAFADEAALATAVELVAGSNDAALRADVLRGLTRNPRPAAAVARDRLVGTMGWKAEAAPIAATDANGADESDR